MEKDKKFLPLRTWEDVVTWTEKTLNEINENPTSIAQGNARFQGIKIVPGLVKLRMEYSRLKEKHGAMVETSEFFATKPGHKLLK